MSKQTVWSILGIIVGIFTIIMGINYMNSNTNLGTHLSSVEFGADFYTEEYKATMTASNNIYKLTQLVNEIFSWIMIIFGAFEVCFFGMNLSKNNELNGNKNNSNNEIPKL